MSTEAAAELQNSGITIPDAQLHTRNTALSYQDGEQTIWVQKPRYKEVGDFSDQIPNYFKILGETMSDDLQSALVCNSLNALSVAAVSTAWKNSQSITSG